MPFFCNYLLEYPSKNVWCGTEAVVKSCQAPDPAGVVGFLSFSGPSIAHFWADWPRQFGRYCKNMKNLTFDHKCLNFLDINININIKNSSTSIFFLRKQPND